MIFIDSEIKKRLRRWGSLVVQRSAQTVCMDENEASVFKLRKTIGLDFEKSRAGWAKKLSAQPVEMKGI
ncbi:hypothetical protein [Desulfobulbus propionicus]|uniref:hypothetical protein n=1 Tax=Desulfobulbus propionicus TaxID=894 RepID=UPI00146C2A5E|nr:hypothetical protein [Desulfobulbus propionicus]